MNSRIVIIGAGQAAAQAIETLRRRGHTGSITLIGDEDLLPYQRPPLSKKYLAGALERDKLLIRHTDHYHSLGVDLRLGFAATAIDRARRVVEIADGTSAEYDQLLLATGSRPRLLPAAWESLRPFYLRTAADVERIRAQMADGRRAAIVGGGYIGLEVAATLREAGVDVTVLEAADRVMTRVVSPVMSMFYETEHARRGVRIICKAGATAPATDCLARICLRLEAGRQIPADFLLAAIGVEPVDALARDAGLECADGIIVDEHCRTSDPHIWAAGDCTRLPSVHYGVRVRLESVDNAFEQGTSAALNMLGLTTVHDKVPWFWSDQYDLKMVIVGLTDGADEVIQRGDPSSRAFSMCYLKGGELVAVETVNQTRDQMAARKLILARARPDRAKLADPAVALKDSV